MREPHDAKVVFIEIQVSESGCSQTHRLHGQDRGAKNDGQSQHDEAAAAVVAGRDATSERR